MSIPDPLIRYRLAPGVPPLTLSISDNVAVLTGYSATAVRADPELWLSRLLPGDRGRLLAALQQAAEGMPQCLEYGLSGSDDQPRYFRDCFARVQHEDGHFEIHGQRQAITRTVQAPGTTPPPWDFQQTLFDTLPIGLALSRRDGQLVEVNPAFAAIIGRSVVETLGLNFKDITPPNPAAQREQLQRDGRYGPYEKHYRHLDGHPVPVRLSELLVQRNGETLVLSSVEDISDLKATEQELRRSEQELRTILDTLPDTFYRTDAQGRVVMVSKTVETLLGWTPEEMYGRRMADLYVEPHGRERFLAALAAGDGIVLGYEAELWRKDGSTIWVATSSHYLRDDEGRIIGVEGAARDVSLLKASQAQLDHLAHHDPLTGLANRLVFTDRLSHAIALARREDYQVAVLFLDLDRFKDINDSFGHPAGDMLLQEAAERLTRTVREQDTVARLGGDEFIILLDAIEDPQDAVTLARKLIDAFEPPFTVAGHTLRLTLSLGISLYPRDGNDAETLVRNADAAMYRAKDEGRNGFNFYTARLTTAALERLTLETALRRAVEHGEFQLHYQPQVSLQDGRLLGAEALIRWLHPDFGLVYPDGFIPLSERLGLAGAIGAWVMTEACKQMRDWDAADLSLPRMGINIAGAQVQQHRFAEQIANCLRQAGVAPQRLELEITEGFMLHKREPTVRTLSELRDLGVSVAIDDFGTGYSSLSQLKTLPIDKLKIDKSFVRDIHDDPSDRAITLAIIAMAQSLNLAVIAEGIETEQQRDFLQAHGCLEGQGFLYSTALPAEAFATRWLHPLHETAR